MTEQRDVEATRRTLLKAGLAAVGGVVATRARAQEKIAQPQVQYQNQPKDGQKCSACVNFVAPNACTIVSGVINPEGWCIAYAPKEEAK